MQLKIISNLYLRFNCIGFTGNYFLLAGFSTFYRRHPILPAIIYQIASLSLEVQSFQLKNRNI